MGSSYSVAKRFECGDELDSGQVSEVVWGEDFGVNGYKFWMSSYSLIILEKIVCAEEELVPVT